MGPAAIAGIALLVVFTVTLIVLERRHSELLEQHTRIHRDILANEARLRAVERARESRAFISRTGPDA